MTTSNLLVFDLDGTLIDTIEDLLAALNHVLVQEGCRPVSANAVRSMIGGGAQLLLERGLAANGRSVDESDLKHLFGRFIDHYETHIAVQSRPFPGVLDAMARLSGRGWRFAICTNKLECMSNRLIGELGMAHHFEAICGGNTFDTKKPHPDHLLGTIARAGGVPDRAVMIGDSSPDIKAAKAAGVPVVAVDFGYTDIPVAELSPDRVISHYDELDTAIAELGFGAPGAA